MQSLRVGSSRLSQVSAVDRHISSVARSEFSSHQRARFKKQHARRALYSVDRNVVRSQFLPQTTSDGKRFLDLSAKRSQGRRVIARKNKGEDLCSARQASRQPWSSGS